MFNSSQQIDAGLLNVGYAELGPADGPAVILLHGWPFDIYSYVDDAPLLAAKGYRVIIPHLRGHGTTRFLASGTSRNCQRFVAAQDILRLMDALKIEKAILDRVSGLVQTFEVDQTDNFTNPSPSTPVVYPGTGLPDGICPASGTAR